MELGQTLNADAAKRKRPRCYSQMDIAMTAFIRYVSDHYEQIIDNISREKTASAKVHFLRFQNVYSLLQHIGSIVYDFGVAYGVIACTKEQFMQNLQNILISVIQYNDAIGLQSDPTTLFLTMLVPAVKLKQIKIAPTKEAFAMQTDAYLGFFEDENDGRKLKMKPFKVYTWILRTCRDMQVDFSAERTELFKKLFDAGFSEGYQQKNHASKPLKQVTINGDKLALLVLRWDFILTTTE